jgi:anti-sigma factor RsiW
LSCNKEEFVHGYLDGELDLSGKREIEHHMQECQDCARAHRNLKTLRSSLKTDSLYYAAPDRLKTRVQSALRKEASVVSGRAPGWPWWKLAVTLGSVAVVGLLLWMFLPRNNSPSSDLAQQVVSNHVRSLLPVGGHLTDVLSSDQHTVKPWFDGKVDFAPPVKDFPNQDFHLYGGRLEYLDNRTVATLVYQRRLHYINLYIWPAKQAGSTAETSTQVQGYNVIHWTVSGMTYWAVSDLNSVELHEFARLVQQGS